MKPIKPWTKSAECFEMPKCENIILQKEKNAFNVFIQIKSIHFSKEFFSDNFLIPIVEDQGLKPSSTISISEHSILNDLHLNNVEKPISGNNNCMYSR